MLKLARLLESRTVYRREKIEGKWERDYWLKCFVALSNGRIWKQLSKIFLVHCRAVPQSHGIFLKQFPLSFNKVYILLDAETTGNKRISI